MTTNIRTSKQLLLITQGGSGRRLSVVSFDEIDYSLDIGFTKVGVFSLLERIFLVRIRRAGVDRTALPARGVRPVFKTAIDPVDLREKLVKNIGLFSRMTATVGAVLGFAIIGISYPRGWPETAVLRSSGDD